MNVYEYFIKQYQLYILLKKQFDDSYNKVKNIYEENIANERQNVFKENSINKETEVKKENIARESNSKICDKQILKEDLTENIVVKCPKEEMIFYIFKKLSLYTHPDKTKDDKLIVIFRTLNEYKMNEDFTGIFYILTTFPNKKIRNNIIAYLEQNFQLFKILEVEINLLNKRISNMKESLIWNCYYNNCEDIRKNAQEKLWILISNNK